MPVTIRVCICVNMSDERGAGQLLLYDLATHDRHHSQVQTDSYKSVILWTLLHATMAVSSTGCQHSHLSLTLL
jgi:hypothetical protein